MKEEQIKEIQSKDIENAVGGQGVATWQEGTCFKREESIFVLLKGGTFENVDEKVPCEFYRSNGNNEFSYVHNVDNSVFFLLAMCENIGLRDSIPYQLNR